MTGPGFCLVFSWKNILTDFDGPLVESRVCEVSSRLGKSIQPLDFRVRRCVQRGDDDQLVGGKITRRRIDEIDFSIHSIECVVEGAASKSHNTTPMMQCLCGYRM